VGSKRSRIRYPADTDHVEAHLEVPTQGLLRPL
jgi:hypothetical protein